MTAGEQLLLAVPLPEPPAPVPPTYFECRGPHDWRPVTVVCRYGPTGGLSDPVFPHVQTKPFGPRNVTIRRTDGEHRVVPVRTLRRRNPDREDQYVTRHIEQAEAINDASAQHRHLADEAQQTGEGDAYCRTPETHNWGCGCPTDPPHRGDRVDVWLRARREEYPHGTTEWQAVDHVLDTYRLHADTRTLLTDQVCDCSGTANCECQQPGGGRRRLHITRT